MTGTTEQAVTPRQCKAHRKSDGARCTRPSIKGGRVCHQHGGAAPQVKLAARERLNALVDPAIGRLGSLVRHKHPFVALGAVKDVLDRTGYKPVLAVQSDNQVTVVVEYVGAPELKPTAETIEIVHKALSNGTNGHVA